MSDQHTAQRERAGERSEQTLQKINETVELTRQVAADTKRMADAMERIAAAVERVPREFRPLAVERIGVGPTTWVIQLIEMHNGVERPRPLYWRGEKQQFQPISECTGYLSQADAIQAQMAIDKITPCPIPEGHGTNVVRWRAS